MKIMEGIAGTFFYHLSESGRNMQPALCGATQIMTTEIPLERWDSGPGNVGARYCKTCTEKAGEAIRRGKA